MTIHSPPARRPVAHRLAFTLPEVLAALVLVGVVLPAVAKGISLAMAVSDEARKKVEATALAETKLAEVTAEANSGTQVGMGSGDFGETHPAFRWESATTVIDVDLTEVSVQVIWTARGVERSVGLSSLVYTGAAAGTIAGGGTGTGTGTGTGGAGSGGAQ